jgi:hypothetical protein
MNLPGFSAGRQGQVISMAGDRLVRSVKILNRKDPTKTRYPERVLFPENQKAR